MQRLSTSLRTRTLDDTLALATGLIPRLRITSCVDVTPHDVLGVPVWFSTRAGGPAGTLSSGKGVVALEAQVGALMEAIECAVAERADARCGDERMALGDVLSQFGPTLTIADLAPRFGAAATAQRTVRVDICEDLASGARIRLPAEMLRLVALPADDGEPLFGSSSNGLASGNSLAEATLHGLLEVLERDCIALDLARPAACRIATASLPEPFGCWSRRWQALGIALHVRVLSNAFGLPCFEAELAETASALAPRALGFGLHPDTRVALARAVTEAAQSRLHALRHPRPAAVRSQAMRPAAGGTEAAFGDLGGLPCDSIEGTLQMLQALLRVNGLPSVLRRHLNASADACELDGLHVVKVVVPGCESALDSAVRIGRRLARRLARADG